MHAVNYPTPELRDLQPLHPLNTALRLSRASADFQSTFLSRSSSLSVSLFLCVYLLPTRAARTLCDFLMPCIIVLSSSHVYGPIAYVAVAGCCCFVPFFYGMSFLFVRKILK